MAAGVLMSELPGRPRFDLPDPAAVRDVLAAVHSVDPASMAGHRYRGYHEEARLDRPVWWLDRPAWERAALRTLTARSDRAGPLHPPRLPPGQPVVGGSNAWQASSTGSMLASAQPGIDDRPLPAQPGAAVGSRAGRRCLGRRPGLGHRGGVRHPRLGRRRECRWPGAIPSALVALGAPPVDAVTTRRRLEPSSDWRWRGSGRRRDGRPSAMVGR